jgi:hypothetical protein
MPGATTARGYGADHQRLRAEWDAYVQAGDAYCHAAICLQETRWIEPGTPWDLGHTPDRQAYTGPEHPKCNRTEGARRGNRNRQRAEKLTASDGDASVTRLTTFPTSRKW